MTARDLDRVLNTVAKLGRRASDRAMAPDDFPVLEPAAILEELTGVRMPHERAREVGPAGSGVALLAKSVVVLASMLAARHGQAIDISGILDDLGAPNESHEERATRICLRCRRPFNSDHRGNRICGPCVPRVAAAERVFAPAHYAEPARVEGL